MSNIRELSQLASVIHVNDETRNVGIGTTAPEAKLSVGGNVVASGNVTADAFYGDGSNLQGVVSGVGIQSAGVSVGTGITTLNFVGAGNTFTINGNTVDISISGGGGGASVSISTVAPESPNVGDLWYSPTYGRTFIYYEDDDSSQWVDSAPFNIGSINAGITTYVTTAGIATYASTSGIATYSLISGISTYASTSGIATYSLISGISTYASTSGIATYANTSGVSTYSQTSGISTYALTAGIATYAQTSGISTYASTAGVATVAQGLSGTPNIAVGNITGSTATFTDLTVNGSQTIINTTELNITDKTVGIASTATPTDSLADGAGIIVYGNTNKSLTYNNTKKAFEFNIPLSTNENRFITGSEKITIINGNTVNLSYSSNSSNVAICTNPTGNITLNVTGIPTSSDFDNSSMTFTVISNATAGVAYSCLTVTLNEYAPTIKWIGGSSNEAVSGASTTSGYTFYSFSAVNVVGSASSTANYQVFGSVSGGFW